MQTPPEPQAADAPAAVPVDGSAIAPSTGTGRFAEVAAVPRGCGEAAGGWLMSDAPRARRRTPLVRRLGRWIGGSDTHAMTSEPAAPEAAVAEQARGDLALLAAVVRQYGFADYAQIRAIRAADPAEDAGVPACPVAMPPRGHPAGSASPGPRLACALMPDPAAGAGDGPLAAAPPVSRYMAQVRDARAEWMHRDPACAYESARFATWYVTEGAAALRDTAPVQPALAAFLAADAAGPWQPAGRQSRLMACLTLLAGPRASASAQGAGADGEAREAAQRWLEASDRWPALDPALVPDWVAKALSGIPADGRGAPFALGAWLMETHRASPTYRGRYDIATPAGRVAFAFDMVLHHVATPVRRLVLNQALVDWFAAPLDGVAGAPSRMEALLGLAVGWLAPGGQVPGGGDGAALVRAYRARACTRFPVLAAFASAGEESWRAADTQFELIGMASSETGLGQNLWMSATALQRAGMAPLIRDSEAGLCPVGDDLKARRQGAAGKRAPGAMASHRPRPRPRRKAALIHLNADAAPQVLCHTLIDRHPDLHAIGFLLWELEALPRAHALALDLLDEIWCPSRFLTEIYAAHTDTPVHTVGKAIDLPAPTMPDRRRLGLDPADTVFLVSFDFHSSVERKNPLAALKAFQLAFGGPTGRGPSRSRAAGAGRPRLVMKTTPPVAGHWGDPNGMWPAISAAAEQDDRIVIIDSRLPFDGLLGLVATADALVSPHRGEGFGYMPAYALALGRPVIATDYGGSRDFVTAETAYPVAWTPRAVAPGETIMPLAGAFWADIEIDALAAAMAAVAADPDEAGRRAARGRQLIETEYSPEALARRYRARLAAAGVIGEDG